MSWTPQVWAKALLTSHGYKALLERYSSSNNLDVMYSYPCNLPVLQQALGVIVHSEHSRILANNWYGEHASKNWQVMPMLQAPSSEISKENARRALGLDPDVFLVCSFGMLGPTKLSHRIFDSFILSSLMKDPFTRLIFVGEMDEGDYGQQILHNINQKKLHEKIQITGWTDDDVFRHYLAAADIAIQLRTMSRGETSATVLDCMNHGLPTVINAHGSLGELDPEAVWILQDVFEDDDLAEGMTTLWQDADLRRKLGRMAQTFIRTKHAPDACAVQYAEIIENIYRNAKQQSLGLLHHWAEHPPVGINEAILAKMLAVNFPPRPRLRQMLIDVSTLVKDDIRTGTQKVTCAILLEYLLNPPNGWVVEPVYIESGFPNYRYAKCFVSRLLGISDDWATDSSVDAWDGDIFLGIDLCEHIVPQHESILSQMRLRGVTIAFIVHDLLPALRPDWWQTEMSVSITPRLQTITHVADGLVCISKTTLDDLVKWLDSEQPQRHQPLRLGYFYLGSDIENSSLRMGQASDFEEILQNLNARPAFLMVGTIEPHKGHAQSCLLYTSPSPRDA